MQAFISDIERNQIKKQLASRKGEAYIFFNALKDRVTRRVEAGNFFSEENSTTWYYSATEYLSDAAMLYYLQPGKKLGAWISKAAMEIANRPEHDWIGPSFRDHREPFKGHLETAHVCWTLSIVYDLCGELFSKKEHFILRDAIRSKGIINLERWLESNHHLGNWRGVIVSGIMVSASVLDELPLIEKYLPALSLCLEAFQKDGSYGESLQYGNYLSYAIMLSYESLHRKFPEKSALIDVSVYGRAMEWTTYSMFYQKPLHGWGESPRARAANFNDSAASFRPSGDVLLHIMARANESSQRMMAEKLFRDYYSSVVDQGPHDLAAFGMRNDWGFLALPLLSGLERAKGVEDITLSAVRSFSNGHSFIRDRWEGKSIIAINGGGDPLCAPGHLHGDLNSFIVVHNQERLLVDPGHSCYRNLIHGIESATQTHNTCTFQTSTDALGLQEDLAKAIVLEQKNIPARREIKDGQVGPAVDRGARLLISQKDDVIAVVGSEAGKLYGSTITSFKRFWLLAGSHVLFVVDQIESSVPVKTTWNFLVNNQDGKAITTMLGNSFVARKGNAGMKLFHCGGGAIQFPVNGFVHDAYHVEPGQLGEGKSGSGLLYRFAEKVPSLARTVVHAITLDEADTINLWQLEQKADSYTLSNGDRHWELQIDLANKKFSMISGHRRQWDVTMIDGEYRLERNKKNAVATSVRQPHITIL